MIKYKKWIGGASLIPLIILIFSAGIIHSQSSTNYKIKKSIIDQGGGRSQSTNHKLLDAVGLSTPIGASNSTNYKIFSGLLFGGSAIETPVLSVTPTTLDYGTSQTSLTFEIKNNGSGVLEWTVQENPDKPWITSINPNQGSDNATVTVTVDHSKLNGSSDTGTLMVSSNGGTENVTVKIGTSDNLLVNGDFSDGMDPWVLYVDASATATASVQNGECVVEINNGGTEIWHVQLLQPNLLVENGKTYELSFEAWAVSQRQVSPRVEHNGEPWTMYHESKSYTLTPTKQTFKYQFTMNHPTDANAVFKIHLGTSNVNVTFNNIVLREVGANPSLSINPTTLDFGTSQSSLTFEIKNNGGGTLQWTVQENPDKPWISSINPNQGNNDATVTVTVDRFQLSSDSDTGTLLVTSNGGNANITVQISRTGGTLPAHWEFTDITGNSANIFLTLDANPNIGGLPLRNDVYVGVFTPAGLCCGWKQWNGSAISITAWGDNPETPQLDGFAGNELITYRVYRINGQKEWTSVSVDYSEGNGYYSPDAVMTLSRFDVIDVMKITLNLTQGWNMFSINVNPDDPSVATVMQPIVDKVKIVKNNDGETYVPRYGINDIGNIDFKEGYQVYTLQTAVLDVSGQGIDTTTPISLLAGWSMISYLPDVPIDVVTALASIEDQLKIAKNNDGETYVPRYSINDIGDMEPGQGYQVYMKTAGTLVYPAGRSQLQKTATASDSELNEMLLEHFTFTSNTGGNATVIVTTDAAPQYSDGTSLEIGDEIGVFTSDSLCCGAIVWEGTNSSITVWPDNSETPIIDGITVGDTMRYRVWKKSTDTEYSATVSYEVNTPCTYQPNGFSVLTTLVADLLNPVVTAVNRVSHHVMPTDFRLLKNHPNPFNPETIIEYHLPQECEIKLTIYDIQGHEVRRLIHGRKSAGFHSIAWNGTDRAGQPVASGIYFYRLEVGQSIVDVKKMILLK